MLISFFASAIVITSVIIGLIYKYFDFEQKTRVGPKLYGNLTSSRKPLLLLVALNRDVKSTRNFEEQPYQTG